MPEKDRAFCGDTRAKSCGLSEIRLSALNTDLFNMEGLIEIYANNRFEQGTGRGY